jgi:hypothetical protein
MAYHLPTCSLAHPSHFFLTQKHVQYDPLWPVAQLFMTMKPPVLVVNLFPSTLAVHCPTSSKSVPGMTTLETVKQLVKEISTLSSSLSDAVPKGSKDDKIWSVMNTKEGDTPHETFNRRFDALFGEDCRDSGGRLHYVRQGKLGMGLVTSYLSKINWSMGFPLDLVELKFQRLITELKHLQCVPN